MTKRELLEYEALTFAHVPQMPPEEDKDTPVWVHALAKIKTYDLEDTFAVLRNGCGENHKVVKVFGTGGIGKIVSVHPYEFLDGRLLPDMDDTRRMQEYVMKTYGVPEKKVRPLKEEQLRRLIYNAAINDQVSRAAAERKRLEELERKKNENND